MYVQASVFKIALAQSRHLPSYNIVNIDSGNGFSHVRHQAITSANGDLMLIRP